ncbi:MAG: hypothetical protein KDA57_19505 [Planctomycetales bacterium]|nr:hypothetical protein [Planctomycetales bacterium]
MSDAKKKTLAELERLRLDYREQQEACQRLEREVVDWLDAGNELQQSLATAANNASTVRRRLERLVAKIEARIDEERDAADWWKSA